MMLIAGTVGGTGWLGGGEPLLMMAPEQAAACARDGYDRGRIRTAIFERAVMPAERFAPAVRESLAGRGVRGALRVAEGPEDILIVVAGGAGVKGAYAPAWGGGTRAVSRRVTSGQSSVGGSGGDRRLPYMAPSPGSLLLLPARY